MQIYRFDSRTREFMYEEKAALDPLETEQRGELVWLIPANATLSAPPEDKNGFARCWTGEKWEYVEDHRQKIDRGGTAIAGTGTPYWLPGDTWESPARYMKELGGLPEGSLQTKPEKPAEVLAQEAMLNAKAKRAATVAKNTVIVDGLVFDADEESQNRLSRGIVAALALGLPADQTTEWTLADNTAAQVTVQQMAQALLLAGQAQTSVWRKPYEAQPASVQEE